MPNIYDLSIHMQDFYAGLVQKSCYSPSQDCELGINNNRGLVNSIKYVAISLIRVQRLVSGTFKKSNPLALEIRSNPNHETKKRATR